MIEITYFDTETGQITMNLAVNDATQISDNQRPGWAALIGRYSASDYYVANSEPIPFPPRPSHHHVWDWSASEWTDPRTPADLAAELEARRDAAWLDKSSLLLRLMDAKILSEADADAASGGEIPALLAPHVDGLPSGARTAARVKWKADAVISRKHPVIVSAAYALGVSDETLDQIFGVTS